ncbi:MAG: hypothetical protein H6830_06135 [Planctomycetes bacterium]|nr:hypothetical protein [Planctomycetota bacterium]MCB9909100.1 hypothetical protein [Planctomycetota bacterium]MCB9911650.1 hypothetical protein [Planctomycetota bacterium]HPF14362.1 hypothetical protein [Planctomycetota bacterium]
MEPSKPAQLRIQTPCPKAWNQMQGDGAKRFCDQCQLHVHNSEALTRSEAEALVRSSEERVCMRLVIDATGQPKFRAEPEAQPPGRLRAAGLAFAAAGVLAACQPTPQAPPNHAPGKTGQTSNPADPAPDCEKPVSDAGVWIDFGAASEDPEGEQALMGDVILQGEVEYVEPEAPKTPEETPIGALSDTRFEPVEVPTKHMLGKVIMHSPDPVLPETKEIPLDGATRPKE